MSKIDEEADEAEIQRLEALRQREIKHMRGWKVIKRYHPTPHAIYRVYRPYPGEFHATPCYGLHPPQWVPRNGFTKEESPPIAMEYKDLWTHVMGDGG